MHEGACPWREASSNSWRQRPFSHLKVSTHWSYFCNPTKLTTCTIDVSSKLLRSCTCFVLSCFDVLLPFRFLLVKALLRHVSFTKFFDRNAWVMRFCAVQFRSLHPLALPRSVFLAILWLFPCQFLTLPHLSNPLMHGCTAQTANLLAFTPTGVTHCRRGNAACIQAAAKNLRCRL